MAVDRWPTYAGLTQTAYVDTFGQAALYTPDGGSQTLIRGAFDQNYLAVDLQGGVPVSTLRTVLGVKLSDLPFTPAAGDTFILVQTGVKWRIEEVQPDGEGGAELFCHLAPS